MWPQAQSASALLVDPIMVYHYWDADYVAMPIDNIWYARTSGLVWYVSCTLNHMDIEAFLNVRGQTQV